jgi:hypothetical protein
VVHVDGLLSEGDGFGAVKQVNRRRLFDGDAKHPTLLDRELIERKVVAMKVNRNRKGLPDFADSRHVIEMGVRQENLRHREAMPGNEIDELAGFISRIDDDRLTRLVASDDEPVLEEWSHGSSFENHP